jgi:hypothetical protein
MTEEKQIKRRGRPPGARDKTRRKVRVTKKTVKTRNPGKVRNFAVAVTPQHYWLITAIAEAQNVARSEILEWMIGQFISTLGDKR